MNVRMQEIADVLTHALEEAGLTGAVGESSELAWRLVVDARGRALVAAAEEAKQGCAQAFMETLGTIRMLHALSRDDAGFREDTLKLVGEALRDAAAGTCWHDKAAAGLSADVTMLGEKLAELEALELPSQETFAGWLAALQEMVTDAMEEVEFRDVVVERVAELGEFLARAKGDAHSAGFKL